MKLVIIESPGKREALKKYLGEGYDVESSKGHVRDLPIKTLGIDMTHNFEPKYEILNDKKAVIETLRKKASKADEVLLATDPDREGEAISWHIAHCLGMDLKSPCRIVFNEISKNAVQNALKQPREIDIKLVDAQQARRVLDRIVGYKLSPIICKKIQPKLSAGRVQSVALKLVVDREKEIINFKPEESWNVVAELNKNSSQISFKSNLSTYKNKKLKLVNKAQADECISLLNNNNYIVKSVKKSKVKVHAPAPFTTSTMQQDALNKLGMSLKKTSACAQELYEGVEVEKEGKLALITYIRTDSTRVSEQAQANAREYIINKYGKDYIPTKPNYYATKKNAQDAHEAIRPITLDITPEKIKNTASADDYKLYKLIYDRFLASQMSEALYDSVSVEIENGDYMFKSSGRTMDFAGYTAAYKEVEEKNEKSEITKLPKLEENDKLNLISIKGEQKFTKPPQRFTEASLVKAMEEKGIGRPATYAPTITVLAYRKYTEKDGKYLIPTELGTSVTKYLENNFKNVINVQFTAHMESRLDDIAEVGEDWHSVINNFWTGFKDLLNKADTSSIKKEPVMTDMVCEKCGAQMVEREGKYGKFLGCSKYPTCKNIISLNTPKEVGVCPECAKPMTERRSKTGKIFYSCSGYPDCKYMSWDIPLAEKCDVCGTHLFKKGNKVYCEKCKGSTEKKGE